jgi:hypothetical protein
MGAKRKSYQPEKMDERKENSFEGSNKEGKERNG